jgi:hypothetical protein
VDVDLVAPVDVAPVDPVDVDLVAPADAVPVAPADVAPVDPADVAPVDPVASIGVRVDVVVRADAEAPGAEGVAAAVVARIRESRASS